MLQLHPHLTPKFRLAWQHSFMATSSAVFCLQSNKPPRESSSHFVFAADSNERFPHRPLSNAAQMLISSCLPVSEAARCSFSVFLACLGCHANQVYQASALTQKWAPDFSDADLCYLQYHRGCSFFAFPHLPCQLYQLGFTASPAACNILAPCAIFSSHCWQLPKLFPWWHLSKEIIMSRRVLFTQ